MEATWQERLWPALRQWGVTLMGIIVTAGLPPFGITFTNFSALLLAALILTMLHLYVRPVLVLLCLPLLIVTLGMFFFVINALLLMLTGALVPGYTIPGFFSAFFAGLMISLLGFIFSPMEREAAQRSWRVRVTQGGVTTEYQTDRSPFGQSTGNQGAGTRPESRHRPRRLRDEGPRNPPPGNGPIIDV